ncbi:hypothetical protein CSB11_01210 [Candidatus Campbellbacteria bacterium]|nr:MAG: hypothetical protein CSB11_01210 [Candidatus Campbellbacteria bacterium]
MKKIVFLILVFFSNVLFAEDDNKTIVTFYKPYGCKMVIEGFENGSFYFKELKKNVPNFPYEFTMGKDENVFQVQEQIEPGKYAFSGTWKKAGFSKKIIYFITVKDKVNEVTFNAPAWCDLKETSKKAVEKTKEATSKGVGVAKDLGKKGLEASKNLGEKGLKKASELLQKAGEKLAE